MHTLRIKKKKRILLFSAECSSTIFNCQQLFNPQETRSRQKKKSKKEYSKDLPSEKKRKNNFVCGILGWLLVNILICRQTGGEEVGEEVRLCHSLAVASI